METWTGGLVNANPKPLRAHCPDNYSGGVLSDKCWTLFLACAGFSVPTYYYRISRFVYSDRYVPAAPLLAYQSCRWLREPLEYPSLWFFGTEHSSLSPKLRILILCALRNRSVSAIGAEKSSTYLVGSPALIHSPIELLTEGSMTGHRLWGTLCI